MVVLGGLIYLKVHIKASSHDPFSSGEAFPFIAGGDSLTGQNVMASFLSIQQVAFEHHKKFLSSLLGILNFFFSIEICHISAEYFYTVDQTQPGSLRNTFIPECPMAQRLGNSLGSW